MFAKVKKHLWDANFIPIDAYHDNNIMDTIFYEVNYLDVQKGFLEKMLSMRIYFQKLMKMVIYACYFLE